MTPSRQIDKPDIEPHYTVSEIAKAWNLAPATVRMLFEEEPGVLKISQPRIRGKRRPRVTLRVPASVQARVHQKLTRVR